MPSAGTSELRGSHGESRANFVFLKQEFPHAAESASFAERHVFGDPRASCFHARHALERLLKRVYKVEKTLKPPKVTNLDGYISDPAFRELVPEAVWQKAEYIRRAGNVAAHGNKSPTHRRRRWMSCASYFTSSTGPAAPTCARARTQSLQGKNFDESLVPKVEPATTPASVQELEALKAQRDADLAASRKEIESELEELRERLAAIKAENEGVATRPMTGTRTRPERSSSISIWSAPVGLWTGNRTVNTK